MIIETVAFIKRNSVWVKVGRKSLCSRLVWLGACVSKGVQVIERERERERDCDRLRVYLSERKKENEREKKKDKERAVRSFVSEHSFHLSKWNWKRFVNLARHHFKWSDLRQLQFYDYDCLAIGHHGGGTTKYQGVKYLTINFKMDCFKILQNLNT